jgi:Ca2+-binding EF-hand superfamily protein
MLSKFQKEKITKVFRLWDADQNGFLELDDWDRITKRRAELAGLSPEAPEYQNISSLHTGVWETLREHADTNRDERVSLDEFLRFVDKQISAVREISFEGLPDIIRALFEVIVTSADRDQDGKITADDYAVFLSGWSGHDATADAKARFERDDRDGDGYISVEETKQRVAEFVLSNDPEVPGISLFG